MINNKIIQDTQNQIKELCSLLQSLCPIQTLKKAYWEFIFKHLGIETESAIGIKEIHSRFLIEYLQSLFISIDLKKPIRQPTNEEWEKIKQKVKQIHDVFQAPIHLIENQDNFKKSQEDLSLFLQVLSSWHIRGNRYVIHEYEHLNKLLTPHDNILKNLYEVNALDIAKGVQKVCLNLSSYPKFFQEYGSILKQFKPLYNALQKQNVPNQKIKESLKNKIRNSGLKEKKEELENKLFKDDLFDIEKITNWSKSFIKKFSATVGYNKDFLTNGKYPGSPLQKLPIIEKPFLEYDSKFYFFNPYILQDYLYRNIQSAILEDRPNYSKKWNKIQASISENLPFEILEKIIGPHEQIKNFYYKIKDQNGVECWFESDGIILFEEWLFVIEVKSGKMSNKPPAQNVVSHFESIKKLLVKPAEQGRRFIEALKKNKILELYDEKKRNIIRKISIDDFTQSMVMAVSLEQLTDISPQIQYFKQLKLSHEGEAILFISIDDLRVYRDLSNGVIDFFHFLTERKKAFYNKKLTLNDELDHFGMYLKYNEYHDITKNMPNSDLNIFAGYRDEIDRYLGLLFLDPEKAVKPRQSMPSFLEAVIKNLEFNRKSGFIKIGAVIYSLSHESRNSLNQGLINIMSLQYNKRNIMPSIFSLGDLSVSFIIRMPDIQMDFTPRDYAIKNMFIQEKEEILLLDISVDEKNKITNVSFEWIRKSNLNEEDVIKYKEEAKKFADFRYFNKIKQLKGKKVGRNEKCPCGSGKKYKRCHGK